MARDRDAQDFECGHTEKEQRTVEEKQHRVLLRYEHMNIVSRESGFCVGEVSLTVFDVCSYPIRGVSYRTLRE